MEALTNIFSILGGIAWGPYMLAFIGFTGLYLIIYAINQNPLCCKVIKRKAQ